MNTVAQTILAQLGGNRFTAMTGARYLVAGPDFLQFTLPRGFARNAINSVVIRLDPSDTYTVLFNRRHGAQITKKASAVNVYADQLQSVFTEQTGLYTSL